MLMATGTKFNAKTRSVIEISRSQMANTRNAENAFAKIRRYNYR